MAAELTIQRSSFPAWLTISSWSLVFNLLLTVVLSLLDGWLGLFLTGPMMLLASLTGLAGMIQAKDSYRAGRTQGAIIGAIWNTGLTLWPLQALVAWTIQG